MKIRAVGAELFHVDGRTDGRTDGRRDSHNEANSPNSAKAQLVLYTRDSQTLRWCIDRKSVV
jgi:hypothetical protein